MDKRTLKALKDSIRHWEEIASGEGVERGTSNCALCKLFFADGCNGCPVRERSGQLCCCGTPYFDWCDVFEGQPRAGYRETKDAGRRAFNKTLRKAAQAELDFLKSLLPENER